MKTGRMFAYLCSQDGFWVVKCSFQPHAGIYLSGLLLPKTAHLQNVVRKKRKNCWHFTKCRHLDGAQRIGLLAKSPGPWSQPLAPSLFAREAVHQSVGPIAMYKGWKEVRFVSLEKSSIQNKTAENFQKFVLLRVLALYTCRQFLGFFLLLTKSLYLKKKKWST